MLIILAPLFPPCPQIFISSSSPLLISLESNPFLIFFAGGAPSRARTGASARATISSNIAMARLYALSSSRSRCFLITHLLLASILLRASTISGSSESEVLLRFKDTLDNNGALSNWDPSVQPCNDHRSNWSGLLCSNGSVWGLQMENMGLKGTLDLSIVSELPLLRTISFINNNFEGSFPDLKKVRKMKSIYLSNNKFSGEISDNAFEGMLSLKKLYLDHNQFSGTIPASLILLPRLNELVLGDNQFEGEVPNLSRTKIKKADFSNNQLEGKIPEGLRQLDASSFSGNKDLCGSPLAECPSGEVSAGTIVIIVIVIVAALAGIAAAFVILRQRKQITSQMDDREGSVSSLPVHKKAASVDLDKLEQGQGSPEHSSRKGEQSQKLSFLRDDRERFDLPDLLKASAEILGSGVFGSTYKAALTNGQVVVVKRFRQMNNVGKEDFQEHMRRLGRLRHPNVLPLVAFYYRKEEKLLVSDYVDNVSLAVHLHGNHAHGNPSPDWPTRLKIVKGVAKGLQYLYNELPSLIAPHGHLKSSNVLLNKSYEPLLTDYGLVPITNQEQAQDLMIAYKSPEYKQHNRITKKTDVWSLGILILEILTGKFPANSLQQGKGSDTDLATLVNSVVRDNVTNDVFDKDMGGYDKSNEGEMVKLLKIGLSCCEADVDKRWDMREAVERIEDVKEKDWDEEFYSSHGSERDTRSSRGLSDDFSSTFV